jgi:hypothetical protein
VCVGLDNRECVNRQLVGGQHAQPAIIDAAAQLNYSNDVAKARRLLADDPR